MARYEDFTVRDIQVLGNFTSDGPLAFGANVTEVIGIARVLTDADNGKTFILTTDVTDGATVTLPVHKAGFHCKFIIGALFATTNWVIDTPAADDDTMEGAIDVADAVISVDAADEINFVASAENIGDWVTFFSDGTTWFVDGRALTTAAITATN